MEEVKLEEETIRDSPFDLENDRPNDILQTSNISQHSEQGNENQFVIEENENKSLSNLGPETFLKKDIIEESSPQIKTTSIEDVKNNLRALIKEIITSSDLKRKTLVALTKSINEALEISFKIDNFEIFDEFFFDKFLLMCNKKEPEIIIECMEVCQILFKEDKLLDLLAKQKAPQRKFIDLINFIALFMELFSFTLYFLGLKRTLLRILDYLIGKG